MHLKSFSSFIALATIVGSVRAADSSNVVVMPSTPAPTMAPATAPAPAPNQIVYTPRLPSAAELTSAAAAQGLTVERLEQTANQIVAVYRTSSGQINTVAYQTLPPSNGAATAPVPVATTSAPPVVVYEQPAPRAVYYYDDPVYYPRVWYPPVSLSFGFGFGHRFGGGFRGGGFRHWR